MGDFDLIFLGYQVRIVIDKDRPQTDPPPWRSSDARESGSAWGSVASKIHSPTMVTAWPTPPSSPSSCTVVG